MNRTRLVQTSALGAALLAMAACGGNSSSSSATAGSASPSASSGSAAQIVLSTSKGSVLTDDSGHVLYMFNPDNRGASVCYDECAAVWPPTLTTGAPTAGSGADASLLGTTKRTDGTTQVTYNKYPLYSFTFDGRPGTPTAKPSRASGESSTQPVCPSRTQPRSPQPRRPSARSSPT